MDRILLAEGHGPTRELVARRLADAGYEVLLADAAGPAYEIFASAHPRAAVVAADLPPEGGRHLARRLRDGAARTLVVVIDKGHLGKARGIRGVLDLGANAYVADPTGRDLLPRLARLLEQARAAGAGASAAEDGVSRVLSREPAEQGEVRPGVLPLLLHDLWRVGADGILVVASREVTRRLYLLRGAPVDFDSDARAESLGRWLVDSGRIGEDQYLASLEAMVPGELSAGAALVAAGVLEAGEPLYAALRSHLRAMVGRCAALRGGRWRLHRGAEFAGEVQALEIPPLAPVLEGARAGLPLRHFAEALRPHLDEYPARTPDFQALLPQMALGSADLRLAVAIDGRATLRDFLEAREGELRDAWSLMWFLFLSGAVAFSAEPAAEGDRRYGEARRPSRRRPIPDERAEAIRQAALRILPGSYFAALGVDIAAGPEEVERAWQEVARAWHPDAFAGHELGGLEELLVQILDKVNAAYRVLSNPEKRGAYLAFLLQRHAEGRRKPDVDPEAEIALKRGERALRARRLREAIGAFQAAAERNPREPEYLAMLAFATLRDPALEPEERPRAAARVARKALSLDHGCVRAAVALALAEEAEGDVAGARRRLLAALKLAPGNEVARRALQRVNRVR
ncbi:MAG TPA: DnaJ domain-containing protein [Anaeromyxobacteraceae bacterium]|nr:DnaJ domain-containing protein [Anaeromyxobacteraceae bacterium]